MREKDVVLLRRLQVALAPYVESADIVATDERVVLRCRLDKERVVTIPADKLARRVCRFIQTIEPSVLGGRVRVEDLKLVIWALYAPINSLYPHRSEIRKVTGLVKGEPKLLRFLIWKRIKSTERAKKKKITQA